MKSKRIISLCTFSLAAVILTSCSSSQVKRTEIPLKNRPVIIINDLKNSSGESAYDSVIDKANPIFNSAIAGTDSFRIIERQRLGELLKELELNMTGLVDPNKMKKVGKMLGADAILFIEVGKVTINTSYTETLIGRLRKDVTSTELSARLVNVETGEVIITTSQNYSFDNSSYAVNLEFKVGARMENDNMLYKLFGESADKFAALIADKSISQNIVSKQK